MQELPGLELCHGSGRLELDSVDALAVIGHGAYHAGDLANYRHASQRSAGAGAPLSPPLTVTRSPAMNRPKVSIM